MKVFDELQRFRLIVEHSSNMVVITDAERRIEYVNPSYTRVTGWTLPEVRGLKPGAPRRFVWKPTATIGGGRSAVWACGQVAERLVHMPMRPCSA